MVSLESASNDIVKAIDDFETNLFTEWVEGIKRAMQNPHEKTKFEMSG